GVLGSAGSANRPGSRVCCEPPCRSPRRGALPGRQLRRPLGCWRCVTVAFMKIPHLAAGSLVACCLGLAAHALEPKTVRLEATPATVAYGYYWAEAKPVLRIASGDIVDVDTLLTNTPEGLARAGVPQDKIQESLKAIVETVTGERKGPGGHILTGPIYVEGAEPGDVLEVKILSIDLPLDYGYNGCRGFIPENCEQGVPAKIIPPAP